MSTLQVVNAPKGRLSKHGTAWVSDSHATPQFDDPRWIDLFDTVCTLTPRTNLIIELTGTNLKPQRIKNYTDHMLSDGSPINRPRGRGQTTTARSFLSTCDERLDAAYLYSLYFGEYGFGAHTPVENDLRSALEKLVAVYCRYKSDLHSGKKATVSFETFVVLVKASREKTVKLSVCKDCSSKYIWPAASATKDQICPVCTRIGISKGQCEKLFTGLLNRSNVSANQGTQTEHATQSLRQAA